MIIWGKLIGVVVGAILYRQFGAVLGLLVGHIFDRGLNTTLNTNNHPDTVRLIFFKTVFQIMGHIAKSKGYVSENEIRTARMIMLKDFNLNSEQMALAIQYFNEGKELNFDFDAAIKTFKKYCGKYADLRMYFLELEIKLAISNKILSGSIKDKLIFICFNLGIPLAELEHQLHAYEYHEKEQQDYEQHNSSTTSTTAYNSLEAAYELLGVSANDSMKTIKIAYRRLISKYHPDKLVAKGLPSEMMKIAKEKTQQITVAYDLIARSRT